MRLLSFDADHSSLAWIAHLKAAGTTKERDAAARAV
jgi:hypothetical protein